jgi:hypothetical protein
MLGSCFGLVSHPCIKDRVKTSIVGDRVPGQYIRDLSLFIVCSSSETALLLYAFQILMLRKGNPTFLVPKFPLFIFYNDTFFIIEI